MLVPERKRTTPIMPKSSFGAPWPFKEADDAGIISKLKKSRSTNFDQSSLLNDEMGPLPSSSAWVTERLLLLLLSSTMILGGDSSTLSKNGGTTQGLSMIDVWQIISPGAFGEACVGGTGAAMR